MSVWPDVVGADNASSADSLVSTGFGTRGPREPTSGIRDIIRDRGVPVAFNRDGKEAEYSWGAPAPKQVPQFYP